MLERAPIVAVPAAALALLAWESGAYYPETWGAVLLAEAVALAGCATLAAQAERSRRSAAVVGAFAALAAWQLASRRWGIAPDAAVLEAERTLLYAGAAALTLLAVPRRRLDDLVLGIFAGAAVVTVGGLVEHVLGDGGDRLEEPIGYANASGIVAATTIVLGVGIAVADGARSQRALAAAAVAPGAIVLYLSLSRGALVACAAGLAVLAAASRPRRVSRFALVSGAAIVLVVGAAVVVHEIRDVRSAPAGQQRASTRLVSGSTSYRTDYWAVAADMVGRAPLLGEGAGSFTRTWLRERERRIDVRDAHNVYLETLAESGLLGLCLLLVALGLPLLSWRRALQRPVARAALAAYVALVVHAGVDWDWELPTVTIATVALGVSIARAGEPAAPGGWTLPWRAAMLAGAAALAALAVVVHAGNTALVDAHAGLDRGAADEAAREAERARRFAPWSAEPWRLLGEAEAARGRLGLAERHIRRAIREDPGAWESWLALAFATSGSERARAVEGARRLNPLAPELDVFAASPP